MSSRLGRWFAALALLPLLWAVLHQTGLMAPQFIHGGIKTWWFYAGGILFYLVLERFVSKPMWLYVFGHELTHALTGLAWGAKVHSFKAKSSGGEVRLSKSNAVIALSPYVVPLYALVVVCAYAITRRWWNPPHLTPVFQFLLALALTFHISLTISAIHKHQPDLKVLGFFLSGVLIILGNALVFAGLGMSLFPKTPTLAVFSKAVFIEMVEAWKVTLHHGLTWTVAAVDFIRSQSWTR